MRLYRTTFLDFDARRDPKTPHYCVKCQRDLKPSQPTRTVHLVLGGHMVLHPDDEAAYQAAQDDNGDVGLNPVGMDCARRIGLQWTSEPLAKSGGEQ